jgi:hypothetical protein
VSVASLRAFSGEWIFWLDAACAAGWLGLGLCFAWRRHVLAAFATVCLAVAMVVTAWQNSDSVFGECAGKRGTTVPYHDGMTLCPGQTAVVTIQIIEPPLPAPAPGADRGL